MSDFRALLSRIEELESQAAFQDELHERLNEVVARQDRELTELREQLRKLSGRLRELGEAAAGGVSGEHDEAPPHY
ncbi:MAG: SlyX family protein [Lysobacterales bacterium]